MSILVNILLCMALTGKLQVAGLAIASSVSSTVYALLLLMPLEKKGERVFTAAFWKDMAKTLTATLAMAFGAWLVMRLVSGLMPVGKLGELVVLGATAAAGLVIYFVAAVLLRVPEAHMVSDMAKRILKRGG